MIMECTDCRNCGSFDFGYRIVCLKDDLPATQIYEFQPLGNRDADFCPGFDDGNPQTFSLEEFTEAYAGILNGEVEEEGIRRWCKEKDKR